MGKEASSKKEKKQKGGKGKTETEQEDAPLSEHDIAEWRKGKQKKVIKEGGKRGVEIEGAADMGGLQFFSCSVDEPDGDTDLLVKCMEAMNVKCDPTEEERKG